MGLLKLVMDGLEFLALLDTCVHGLLRSLDAFTLRVQMMTSPHRSRRSTFASVRALRVPPV